MVKGAAQLTQFILAAGGLAGHARIQLIGAPGVGLLDYDNDGDLDLYLVQSQMLGRGKTIKDAMFPPKGPLKDRLYRNDLSVSADGKKTLHFTDVTDQAGIDIQSYGMGVAAGDVVPTAQLGYPKIRPP